MALSLVENGPSVHSTIFLLSSVPVGYKNAEKPKGNKQNDTLFPLKLPSKLIYIPSLHTFSNHERSDTHTQTQKTESYQQIMIQYHYSILK